MIIIFENVLAILERGRGLCVIIFVWWRGQFLIRENRGAYLEKVIKGGLLNKKERREGPKGQNALSSPSSLP